MSGGPAFRFAQARADDLERLAALRVRAMRDSLERIGRFDPERARRRMVDHYDPDHTRLILDGAAEVGCVAFAPRPPKGFWLEHFYIDPSHQGRGLGAAVLAALLAEADAAGEAVELSVLRESPALRLYIRAGFVETARDATDVYLRRDPD
jgi:GNAT superfamily N-acetyltransferase